VTTEVIFWTQIMSIVAFVGTAFFLYRLLSEQKDATIQLLRETVSTLKDQLVEARRTTPDVLAQTLSARAKLLEAELERMSKDNGATKQEVTVVAEKLNSARAEIEMLAKQVEIAHDLLEDFSCPFCGLPMTVRNYFSESVEYQGREIDVDHEYVEYECGYAVRDGKPENECPGTKLFPSK